ncbi:MarR family winged helix-turn-helix transcriptional regulator [Microbacterium sp. CH12i]|uniref:MarR family winged helix-turn-helix transcriptional regulator n=1 Tax=Microbacterium sp. CH12i TaxID=1479651 RepID=UPI000565A1FF|nr:MarR family transcriptional regulator [Microbacterium sp. CH12i]
MTNTTATPSSTAQAAGSERLWTTPVGADLAFLLARANALSLSRIHQVLEELGLRTRAYSVLEIAASDARPSQRELAEFLSLDPSQIVSLVDQLEKRALVSREPDPRDRRANVVVATAEGRLLAGRAREVINDSDAEWFSSLTPDEMDVLTTVLRKLASAPLDE